jgi:hypothetical protein
MKRFVVDQTALQAFSTLIQGDSIWAQKAKEGLSFGNVPTADGPRWAHRETGQYLIRIEAQDAHLEVLKMVKIHVLSLVVSSISR